VISALTLHHLEPSAAVPALAEMDAAARRGILVNDLMRSRTAYCAVWLATRALTRNLISRHDGPLSVRRAYTQGEVRALCEKAGLFDVRVHISTARAAVRGAGEAKTRLGHACLLELPASGSPAHALYATVRTRGVSLIVLRTPTRSANVRDPGIHEGLGA